MNWKSELRVHGWNKDQERFEELLATVFNGMYRASTDEDLLCRPTEGVRFCEAVREAANLPGLPEDLIMRMLTNMRKRSKLKYSERRIVDHLIATNGKPRR